MAILPLACQTSWVRCKGRHLTTLNDFPPVTALEGRAKLSEGKGALPERMVTLYTGDIDNPFKAKVLPMSPV